MELLVNCIDVSSPPAHEARYLIEGGAGAVDKHRESIKGMRKLRKEDEEIRNANGSGLVISNSGDCSSDSSSIGVNESDEEEDIDVVVSSDKTMPLISLASLEESLPIKRGLSNYYQGRSRSFADLRDVVGSMSCATELAKAENPFNKRRRIQMASKLSSYSVMKQSSK